jgi:hypothetical protein
MVLAVVNLAVQSSKQATRAGDRNGKHPKSVKAESSAMHVLLSYFFIVRKLSEEGRLTQVVADHWHRRPVGFPKIKERSPEFTGFRHWAALP